MYGTVGKPVSTTGLWRFVAVACEQLVSDAERYIVERESERGDSGGGGGLNRPEKFQKNSTEGADRHKSPASVRSVHLHTLILTHTPCVRLSTKD